MFSSSLSFYSALVWVLVIGGGWKTVHSVCFEGAFLLMHNSRRKTGDNVFLLERISVNVSCVFTLTLR